MCFFSRKQPSIPTSPAPVAPPAPAPTPVITPSEISPQIQGEARRKRREQLRFGLASTIKTSARGLTGRGPELSAPSLTGKTKLGQ